MMMKMMLDVFDKFAYDSVDYIVLYTSQIKLFRSSIRFCSIS